MKDSSVPGPQERDAAGSRRGPKLSDIARLAGVHLSTASRALNPHEQKRVNPETAERIRQIARQHGYQSDALAAGLRGGRTFTVGIMVADMGNPYLAPVLRGLQDGLDEAGMTAIIAETRDTEVRRDRAIEHLLRRRVDTLIVCSGRSGDEGVLASINQKDCPVVLCVRGLEGLEVPQVYPDDLLGGQLACGYLARLGHKRIAEIPGPPAIASFRNRARGFAGVAAQLDCDVMTTAPAATPTLEEGRRLAETLLATTPTLPTAIFAHNDPMAVGVYEALRRLGLRCPEDVSVLGFNDNPMSPYLSPPLSTLRVAGYEMGQHGARLALGAMSGTRLDTPVALPPELVARESTAPIRHSSI